MSVTEPPLSDVEVIAAIRAMHLKSGIAAWEDRPDLQHWDRASLDPGGTIFGPGPYVKLPVSLLGPLGEVCDEVTIRVFPPKHLQRRLSRQWVRKGKP